MGQEVQCRIGLGMSPSHYNRGWHITATCGVFGAASGSGKLLGLDTRQMVWALGIAATQSSKSLGVGNAARNGLLGALLAARNFAGPAEPLTGGQAYYNALGETPKLAALTEGLGQVWAIMATSYKPYPCGFVIHPVLDCVLDWRRDHPGATVAKVTVIGNPLLGLRTDRPDVSTGAESQVSVQHAVAAALLTGKAGVEQFGEACVNDPKVAALRGRIEVLRDESFATTAAAVEITTADGGLYKLSQSAARGSDLNPMSDRELEDKLRTASAGWDPRYDIEPLIETIWSLHQSPDISKLAALAVPRP